MGGRYINPKQLGHFVLGMILGIGYLYLFFRFPGHFLPTGSSRYVPGRTEMMSLLTQVYIILVIISYLVTARYLYYKKSPLLGSGFVLSILALVLIFFMFILEIMIHPPDEE